ncbi:MAG: nuclear transport factor 2 family protein [Planctomycetes bacterium]|nr:nuclear transport factor 2 family protein [Planctomycetota bacterium]
MTPKVKIAAIVAAAVAIYLLGDFLIVTDRERLEATIKDLHHVVEKADAGKVIAFLAPDYHFQDKTRDDMLAFGQKMLKLTGPMKIKVIEEKLNINGSLAVYESTILATLSNPSGDLPYAGAQVPSQWRLSFKKEGDKWLIYQVEPISLFNQPVRSLDALIR